MNEQIHFDACIIIDMWEPDPKSPGFLQDYKFMNYFHQMMAKNRFPKARLHILTTRADTIDPLLWTLSITQSICIKGQDVKFLEHHKFVNSKQDKICIVGQHYRSCVFYNNLGILDFLTSGYENVYVDINLVNPWMEKLYVKDEFIETFDWQKHKLTGTMKFKKVYGSIFKVTIEEKHENTNSRQ